VQILKPFPLTETTGEATEEEPIDDAVSRFRKLIEGPEGEDFRETEELINTSVAEDPEFSYKNIFPSVESAILQINNWNYRAIYCDLYKIIRQRMDNKKFNPSDPVWTALQNFKEQYRLTMLCLGYLWGENLEEICQSETEALWMERNKLKFEKAKIQFGEM